MLSIGNKSSDNAVPQGSLPFAVSVVSACPFSALCGRGSLFHSCNTSCRGGTAGGGKEEGTVSALVLRVV